MPQQHQPVESSSAQDDSVKLVLLLVSIGVVYFGFQWVSQWLGMHAGVWGHAISLWWVANAWWVIGLPSLLFLSWKAPKWVPPIFHAVATVQRHKKEMARIDEDIRLQRIVTTKLELEGFNTEYANQVTGISIKSINPVTLMPRNQTNNYYGIEEEMQPEQKQLPMPADLRIPTFAESLQAGLIGPGQKEILICHELERDEDTGQLTGVMTPYQDVLENNCTMFLGGASKSGKTTLMAFLGAQEALMNALFYVIDPHLTHPEKSIAVKLHALSHAFILPPASTDRDIKAVLEHAEAEARARVDGKETRYSGRPIVIIIDEVLNLFGRAMRKPDDKELVELYRTLALFMRDLGTQYNKYGVNGIFGSQYVTKDAFKLPGGNIDFRDGCQSQALLRLPANQAQAMRLLDKSDLRGVRRLPPGHGYMGFSNGDVIRMASGNIAIADIEQAGRVVASAPTRRIVESGWSAPKEQKATHLYQRRTDTLSPSQAVGVSPSVAPSFSVSKGSERERPFAEAVERAEGENAPSLSEHEMQIGEMFFGPKQMNINAIVKELYGSTGGDAYQRRAAEVNTAIRKYAQMQAE